MTKLPKPERRRVSVPHLPVVGDAGIAIDGVSQGRMVPLVIVDDSKLPQLSELIRLHEHFDEGGDVNSQWGTQKDLLGKTKIILILEFIRPMKLECVFVFDLRKQGIIVNQIISSARMYIMTGRLGDRYVHKINDPKIYIDIPETGFFPAWNKIYFSDLVQRFKKEGKSQKAAKIAADEFLAKQRKFQENLFRPTGPKE